MKVTFFDLESTDLAASWGRILCGSFVSLSGNPYTYRIDRKKYKGKTPVDDSSLAIAVREELESSDIVVGWNSILHDVPLLNARLSLCGERSCRLSEKNGVRHVDLMWYSSGQSMKIGSRRLDSVSRFFGTGHSKTALDGEIWQLASVGDRKSMNLVVEHCEADVLVLRDLWPKLAPSISKFQFSLGEVWNLLEQIQSRKTGISMS